MTAGGFLIAGCGRSSNGSISSSVQAKPSFCTSTNNYTDPIVISGRAQFQYRTNGNGAIATAKPARYIEVRVTNSNGELLQCGHTNGNGDFSLNLPKTGSTVTLSMASLGSTSQFKAYVLNNPTQNKFHSVSRNITLNQSQNIGNLTAPVRGSLMGAAFHILDQILNANQFIRSETSACNTVYSACTPFTVAPLVTIYWSPGVNPGDYFNLAPLSFYIPQNDELYILGGIDGDVDNTDTDHFDNTIILHEYAHFLEDVLSYTNSPGGMHTGDMILDPRLAWGEGWANYFQAAVTDQWVYRDTFGTIDGDTTGVYVNENLEAGTRDIASSLGEGNFREFSVSRLLSDMTDTNNEGPGTDTVTAPFAEFWTLLTSPTAGFANPNLNFRNIGLFHELQAALTPSTDISELQTAENHRPNQMDYANTLSTSGVACPVTIQAANISVSQPEDGSVENSNLFASNDFYQYRHGGGQLTLALTYTTNSGNPADLDLYLYNNDYTFGSIDSVIGYSDKSISVGQSSGSESFTVNSLAAGTYMININVNTLQRLGAAANYNLRINGQIVCPD